MNISDAQVRIIISFLNIILNIFLFNLTDFHFNFTLDKLVIGEDHSCDPIKKWVEFEYKSVQSKPIKFKLI